MFSIDSCNSTNKEINIGYSETPSQHKSFNIIKLDNGHFAAQPNNRVLFYDKSLTPSKPKMPDYKVSTRKLSVENISRWTAGDSDKLHYELIETDKEHETKMIELGEMMVRWPNYTLEELQKEQALAEAADRFKKND